MKQAVQDVLKFIHQLDFIQNNVVHFLICDPPHDIMKHPVRVAQFLIQPVLIMSFPCRRISLFRIVVALYLHSGASYSIPKKGVYTPFFGIENVRSLA